MISVGRVHLLFVRARHIAGLFCALFPSIGQFAHLRASRIITLSLLIGLGVTQLFSQSTAHVSITAIPTWGQAGQISGYVSGVDYTQVGLWIFEFIPDIGWYPKPTCSAIPIHFDGSFSADVAPYIIDRAATRFSAYLLPLSLSVPCSGQESANVPFIVQLNALSMATIPRLPLYNTISFGGLTWYVKTAPTPVYGGRGPQFFIEQNAYVDSLGQLHLAITQCGNSWCAGEIYTTQEVGYGTYIFTINSPVNNLDTNVTLGLFTWDAQVGDKYNNEWDIEFSRWGNANASANAQYVVQPYNGPNNLYPFLMSPSAPSTHSVTWLPGQVNFQSTATLGLISQFTYPGGSLPVPAPGDVHLHMNFYVAAGQSPAVPINQEIVIGGFQYAPIGAQIGFSQTSSSSSFLGGATYSVPMTGSGGTCSGNVESDSPWLVLVSPNPVSSSGILQYTIPNTNFGSPRTGNLILRSTTCNPTLGSQLLSVTQMGPPQAPVPNVLGETESAAVTAITGAGLLVGTVTTAPSLTGVTAGNVIGENPPAGTLVNAAFLPSFLGSAVNLLISSGAVVTVPPVVGETESVAAMTITGVGLQLGNLSTAASPTVAAGNVIAETPAAWAQVNIGTAVNLVISTGPAPFSVPKTNVGIFRDGFFWILDVDGNQQFDNPPDRAFAFGGNPGDIPITGDWNGDGHTKVGVYRPRSGLFILDSNGDGVFDAGDAVYNLGVGTDPTDIPVAGDWNGDGRTKIGLFRQGFEWLLDYNGNGVYDGTPVDRAYFFGGIPGDVPVVGDWTGTGTSKIGLVRLGFYWILDANGNGSFDGTGAGQDYAFAYGGITNDAPVVGDWNGSGISKVGVFREGFFWVLDGNNPGDSTHSVGWAFGFGGITNDRPVTGKW
jgi:PASTA domain